MDMSRCDFEPLLEVSDAERLGRRTGLTKEEAKRGFCLRSCSECRGRFGLVAWVEGDKLLLGLLLAKGQTSVVAEAVSESAVGVF